MAELQELDRVTNKLNGAWQRLSLQLGILLAGPLAGFLDFIADLTGAVNNVLREKATLEQLDQAFGDNPEFQRRRAELATPGYNSPDFLTPSAVQRLASEFPLTPAASVTPSPAEQRREYETTQKLIEEQQKKEAQRRRALLQLEGQILSIDRQRYDLLIRASETIRGPVEGAEQQLRLQKERC